ncbi:MAG: carbohydrate-binding protein, partial [Rhodothermales bacterium]|nr:carbohydrate-binding protein [Rhodothermales bacterium]
TLQSALNGEDHLSVALLPDPSAETLELFRKHAYAFVTNSTVDWNYNESTAEVVTTYSYETELLDGANGNINETMTALYRHQYLHTSDLTTSHTYQSPNGTMKLREGNTFTTNLNFGGVLPALPDRGDYNRDELLGFVQSVANETLPVGPTYDNGKAMARFTHLVHIAEQLGATTERDHFLSEIKNRLEEWFTAGGDQEYSYIDSWNVLTGYPSGFGADNQINDHHFHASYAVMSAATIAQYDSAWASQENWGGMVNLIIKDANNWDRSDDMFPFLRSHDSYAGHSWAAGHGDFGDGNNQESSSESMNFAAALILWGEATDQTEIRDLGVFLHATETTAVEQYWFDVDNVVFPEDYPHVAIGMVWGGKGVHSTWFGADPEFIHGINILPVTSGSLYLGRHPDHIIANYNEIVSERNSQPIIWQDILWEYLALADPSLALSYYFADNEYEPFDGESRAHTLHWLYNLKKMGRVDTTVTADTPTYAVFKDANGERTYNAYNAGDVARLVSFSDGYSMSVDPKELRSESTFEENLDAPVTLLFADKTSGKSPLTVSFEGSKSFDRNGSDLEYSWSFGTLDSSMIADTVFTFTELGEHRVTLTVTNDLDLSTSDSVLITVLGNGTPFSGQPVSVPGRVEAENYDNGGEGIAYHDVDTNNIGLAYRPNEGVDLEGASDGGFDVYWITDGEWIEYTFAVDEAGTYDFKPYVATVPGFGYLRMLIDNVDVSGRRRVLNTGGWQFWRAVDILAVELDAGEHIMRFEFESDTDKTGWLMSLNYVDVTQSVVVGTEEEEGLTNDYALNPAYPNPFRTVTQISYSLPIPGPVRLEIFNALGRKVADLVHADRPA